jgi:predicted N-acetyltransferase YhbS
MAPGQLLQRADPDRRFPARFVACLEDETPVGTFTLEPLADPAGGLPLFCLSNVFVDPDWRGLGIGNRLCEAAMEETRSLRIPRLSLMTMCHAAWYASLGWRYVRVVAPLVGGRELPAILMARDVYPPRRILSS